MYVTLFVLLTCLNQTWSKTEVAEYSEFPYLLARYPQHLMYKVPRSGLCYYLDFSNAFYSASHNILAGELRKCGLNEHRVSWIKNWLKWQSSEGCDQQSRIQLEA